jgi:hypothetical protein
MAVAGGVDVDADIETIKSKTHVSTRSAPGFLMRKAKVDFSAEKTLRNLRGENAT